VARRPRYTALRQSVHITCCHRISASEARAWRSGLWWCPQRPIHRRVCHPVVHLVHCPCRLSSMNVVVRALHAATNASFPCVVISYPVVVRAAGARWQRVALRGNLVSFGSETVSVAVGHQSWRQPCRRSPGAIVTPVPVNSPLPAQPELSAVSPRR
jgi:hypothetical protein